MALTGLTKVQKIGINSTTIPTFGGSRNTGVVTATTFIGDGSGLSNVTGSGSGVIVRDGGSLVGTAGTINFGTNLNVSAISAGIVTVTNAASATALTNLSDVTISSPSNGQVLKYNGSAFVNAADTNTTYSQSSVASGSNVNLRLSDGSTDDDILITAGSNITFSSVSANGFTIASSGGGGGGGLSNVVEDTSPELGGNLNLNNRFITGSGGVNVSGVTTSTSFVGNLTGNLTGNITGAVTVGGNITGPLLSISPGSGVDGIILLNSGGGQNNDFSRIRQVVSDDSFVIENKSSGSYESFFKGNSDRGAELHFQGAKKLETLTGGVSVTGNMTATTFTGSGVALTGVVTSIVAGANITLTGGPTGIVTIASSGGGGGGVSLSGSTNNTVATVTGANALIGEANLTFNGTTLALTGSQTISADLDVDGHTELDNVNISGVSTFGNNITASGTSRFEIASMENGLLDGSIEHTGDTTTKIKFETSIIKLDTAGTTRLNINNSGANITGVTTSSAGFVGNLTGTATTATTATNITVSANNSTDETVYPIFVDGATGAQGAESDTGLSYNPNSGALTSGSFVKSGGSSSQFLKADGSVDGSTYLTSGSYLENVSEDSTPDLGGNLNLNSKDITGTGNVNITGIVTTTNLDVSVAYTLGASGSDHFTFTGGEFTTATNDPDLYLERGRRYLFVNPVAGSHPFEIRKPTSGDSSAAAYSTGVTGNGGSGNVIFNVPLTAPSHLYYQCTSHSNMGGNIYITGREDVNTQLSHRNLIINGDMEIAQRGGSVVTATHDTATFRVDRFGFNERTGGSAQLRQSTDVPAGQGFYNSLYANIVSTDSSITGNEHSVIRYVVEDVDVKHLQWGTANAKPLTVSFWVKSNVAGQTLCFNVSNWPTNTRTFIAEYTLPSGTANSWQKHVINIPGDTTGTWTHITLQWVLAASSDYQKSGTGWAAWSGSGGLEIATSNQYNWFGDSNHFYLTGVQLERGNVSTPFEHKSFAEQLARCQRYCVQYNSNNAARDYILPAKVSDGDDAYTAWQPPVAPRTTVPTISVSNASHICLAYGDGNSETPVNFGTRNNTAANPYSPIVFLNFDTNNSVLTAGDMVFLAFTTNTSGGYLRFEWEL